MEARKMVSMRKYGGVVQVLGVKCQKEEAEFIGRDIKNRKLESAKCAVLGRTNKLVEHVASELNDQDIAVFFPQRKYEFESFPVGILIETLRLANYRHDRVVLRRLCHNWQGLTGTVIEPGLVIATAALMVATSCALGLTHWTERKRDTTDQYCGKSELI